LFPRSYLLANPHLAEWHSFGMEWKEHVAWAAPILATAAAFLVLYYGPRLVREPKARWAALVLLTMGFGAAAIAGALGALITKAAPVR
jgi:VIT1/CCC1 family predicted Fe2+/Mn2+ transporter